MIVYFSATGNCKYVANEIARQTNDTAVPILTLGEEILLQEGEPLGIVSPTYCWRLPSIMDAFLSTVRISGAEDLYIYFIATYGTSSGMTADFVQKHLTKQGLWLSARFSIRTADTWTPKFDLSDKEKVAKLNQDEKPQIEEIVKHIQSRDCCDLMDKKKSFRPMAATKLVYDVMRKTSNLRVEEACIGCGLCQKNCPVQAIELRNRKPVWVKDRCVMCLGCLHHCPAFAIQYGKNTKKHGQYVHP